MKNLKTIISLSILLFINFLFSYKYVSRYTNIGLHISIFIILIQFAIYRFSHKINLSNKQKSIIGYLTISFIIGLAIVSHIKLPIESLNVDRWSVISSFFTELFNGHYPYFAKSHMGNYPGPMPVYFLVALPFYLLGELSILSCLGYCIIIEISRRKATNQHAIFLILFLLTSLFLVWEITTRSNLFTFTSIVLLTLYTFTNLKQTKSFKFYGLAILTGLLLSTRSIYILPYIIFFLPSLINNEISFKKLSLFLVIAVLAFASTFAPFIVFFRRDFFTMNPFIIQSSTLVPFSYTVGYILMAIVLSFGVKNKLDKLFYSGLSLFIAILIYAAYHVIHYGYEVSFIESQVDISYFIFCIPFLMLYLLEKNDNPNKDTIFKHKTPE